MMKQHWNGLSAGWRSSLSALTLMSGVFASAGCVELEEPTAPEDGQIVVTELAPLASMQSEVRLERTASGDALRVVSPGWRETAQHVWQSDAGQLVIDTALSTAGDRASPLAVSCTISVYNGPFATAPLLLGLTGTGAVGFAQAHCTGGVARFTVWAQACTDRGCNTGSFGIQAGPPGTWGPDGLAVFQLGTLGASCSARTQVTPSGINQFNSFLCG